MRRAAGPRVWPDRVAASARSNLPGLDAFTEALREALEDRTLARRLARSLLEAADSYANETIKFERRRTATERGADVAEEIVRRARQLRDRLVRSDRILRSAIFAGYLKGSHDFGGRAVSTIGDLAWGRWRAGDVARDALAELEQEATEWKARACVDARRPPHRPSPDGRIRLAEWVAINLAREGVRLTKAAEGKYARVLKLLYATAGIQLSDVTRDVRRVVDDESLWEATSLRSRGAEPR